VRRQAGAPIAAGWVAVINVQVFATREPPAAVVKGWLVGYPARYPSSSGSSMRLPSKHERHASIQGVLRRSRTSRRDGQLFDLEHIIEFDKSDSLEHGEDHT